MYNLPSFSMIGKWEREEAMAEKPKKEEAEDLAEAYRLAKMENEYLKKLYALVRKKGINGKLK